MKYLKVYLSEKKLFEDKIDIITDFNNYRTLVHYILIFYMILMAMTF